MATNCGIKWCHTETWAKQNDWETNPLCKIQIRFNPLKKDLSRRNGEFGNKRQSFRLKSVIVNPISDFSDWTFADLVSSLSVEILQADSIEVADLFWSDFFSIKERRIIDFGMIERIACNFLSRSNAFYAYKLSIDK